MNRLVPLAIALALTCGAGTAAAKTDATTGASMPEWFARADTNGDGRIARDEFLAAQARRFDATDRQHRGAIDATDIATSPERLERDERRAERWLAESDRNADRAIDRAEADAAAKAKFDTLDVDHNGVIDRDDRRATASDPKRPRHRRAGMAGRVIAADTNHDRKIDEAEFVAAARERFRIADRNQDGRVTAAELADSPRRLERVARVAAHRVVRLDADHDGLVQREEYLAAAARHFERLDRNDDGAIDRADGPRHGRHRHRG